MPDFIITPEVLKKVERALAKPETARQKKKRTEMLRRFQGNSIIWCNGKGYVRQ